jgi:hypothetical protein
MRRSSKKPDLRFLIGAVFVAAAASLSPAAAKGSLNPWKLGNWIGGAYVDEATGQFDHCGAYAHYDSGATLHVSHTSGGDWLLGFNFPQWKLTPGKIITVELGIDGRAEKKIVALPSSQSFVMVSLSTVEGYIPQFKKATSISLHAAGRKFSFELADARLLLPVLSECVKNKGKVTRVATPLLDLTPERSNAPSPAQSKPPQSRR